MEKNWSISQTSMIFAHEVVRVAVWLQCRGLAPVFA